MLFGAASGRKNTDLRGMDLGLATASFTTKTQTAVSAKNASLKRDLTTTPRDREGESIPARSKTPSFESGNRLTTFTDPSGRKHAVMTKRTIATKPSKSSRESTPTWTEGTPTHSRAEPMKHSFVRQPSPKTKMTTIQCSKTPSRALSPIDRDTSKNGQKLSSESWALFNTDFLEWERSS